MTSYPIRMILGFGHLDLAGMSVLFEDNNGKTGSTLLYFKKDLHLIHFIEEGTSRIEFGENQTVEGVYIRKDYLTKGF